MSYGQELEVARSLATSAGQLVLGYFGSGIDVERKEEGEPVTRADREASELILAGLAHAFPGDVLISEEAPDDPRRLSGGRVWFVDPVDGTSDFIRNLPGFAVMIGLCEGGRPCVAAIYQPVGGRLFLAAPDLGARLEVKGREIPLGCSQVRVVSQIRLVASKSHRTGEIDQVKNVLGISDELNIGSVGLKLGLIALAERDLYVNPSSKSKLWDTCAPEALIVAAGGRLTDLFGDPLRYDQPELRNRRGLVATNGMLHQEVLDRLRHLFPRPAPDND